MVTSIDGYERAALAGELLASLEDSEIESDREAAWDLELRARIEGYERGEVTAFPPTTRLVRSVKDRGIVVCAVTRSIAQRAGGLLAKAKLSSEHAVDAFVVATALDFDGAVIATGDPGDIRRFASGHRQLRVFAL